ncbi:MAG: PEP-CTERM sorting domain-containing protein [Phormidium sp. BM_Day4_Bin.17]|nr:PEP-CTERM sorting domain-containing protein [Phormidium sp. BM_Day4_Bin.17]UCJ13938.1 MAG: PEP-CTERM sorting domain-containing protein [Phormidium sp. PBR-2020]
MNRHFVALSLSLPLFGVAIAAPQANAFNIAGHLDGEQAFKDLGVETPWAAESRIGVEGPGDYEIDIHNSDFSDVTHQQFSWVNGQAYDFSLSFDGSELVYDVAGVTVSKTVIQNSFSDLLIRTTARQVGNSAEVKNLFLNGVAISETSFFQCDGGCDFWNSSQYLHITDVSGPFELTGTSVFSWEGNRPTRSNLAYQVKLVEGKSVPEPASILGLGLIAAGASQLKRRRPS